MMGYFRRHKVRGQTAEQVKRQCDAHLHKVRRAIMNGEGDAVVEELMTDWACRRELLARIENDNEGREA